MRNYELVLVMKPSLTEANRKKLVESVKTLLKGITITAENDWGSKALAYPIKRELTGYYVDFILETEKSIPTDVEKKLINNEDLLRHLLVRTK